MEFTYKFVAKLTTLTDTANHLRETSQPFLEDCLAKGGLYNLLTLPKSTIPNPLLSKLLEYYNPISNTFSIQRNELGITLQDVLFLARIRIDGTPVLVKDYNDNHCRAIFDEAIDDIDRLHKIINDTSLDEDKRKAALLMLIVQCAIMSSHHGNHFYPAFFEVLSDPDGTSGTYAWGAAMLAFLQHHLQKINELKQLKKPEIKIGGCGWLLLCFFFVRIPSLWDVIGLTDVRKEMEAGQLVQHPFPMRWILEKLAGSTLGKDQQGGYLKKMNPVFDSLKDEGNGDMSKLYTIFQRVPALTQKGSPSPTVRRSPSVTLSGVPSSDICPTRTVVRRFPSITLSERADQVPPFDICPIRVTVLIPCREFWS